MKDRINMSERIKLVNNGQRYMLNKMCEELRKHLTPDMLGHFTYRYVMNVINILEQEYLEELK